MNEPSTDEILKLNQRLLDAIADADWTVYQELCDPTLTAFEPEAKGQLVEGLDFHAFYFHRTRPKGEYQTTMCSPRVRIMGDVAVIAYVRLNQKMGPDGLPVSSAVEETRVWHRREGKWKHVHFHRSAIEYLELSS
jgi:calcium/calmodulin-dependent protein kinase (CaM kinase) II